MLNLKNKRCIFLDFDGVINNFGWKDTKELEDIFELSNDKIYVATLDNIGPLNKLLAWCYMNEVYIVISSAWMIRGFKKCKDALLQIAAPILVEKLVIGGTKYTLDLERPVRSKEIHMWLNAHKEFKHFMIIDDSCDFTDEHKKLWVKTIIHDGLTYEKVDEVIHRFKDIDTEQLWIDKEYYKEPVQVKSENDIREE